MNKKIKNFLKILRFFILYRTKHIPEYVSCGDDINLEKTAEKNKFVPKKIWMYWDSGKIPNYIESMIDKIKQKNPEYEINLLNNQTILEYLPSFDIKSDLPLANKADLIRLKLLYEYGGIWLDVSTIFYTSLSWLDQLIDQNNYTNYDCIGYYRDVSTIDREYPIIESWFLCAPQKNEFIKSWYEELEPLKDLGNQAYFDLISSREDYEIVRQKITDPKYLLVYLAEQIAMRKKHFNFYLKKCENDAFYYQEKFNWSTDKITNLLTQVKKPKVLPPIIKLTNYDRSYLNFIIKYKLYNKHSIIGELLEKNNA